MQITREDLNPCTVKLTVVCGPDEVKSGYDKAYKQAAKQIRVPGFRPGHAPKSVIEKQIDPGALNEAAADNIVRGSVKKVLEEQSLEPYVTPRAEMIKLDQEKGEFEFALLVGLKPQVELGDYKSLEAEKPTIDVTEEDVDNYLTEMRQRKSTREAITDRGVEEGDMAVVNIKVDGEEGDGRNFMTIAGQTFPQLDQTILGMKVEEMKSVDLTFPENFQEKDWAGKPLHAQVTIRSLAAMTLPELDDEFAKQYETENMDELRGRIKEGLKRAKEQAVQDYVNEQLIEDLLKKSTVHVPDHLWEQVAEQRMTDIVRDLQEKKRTLEDYAKENGMTPEQLYEAQKHEAELFVKRAQMIQEIFVKEEMKLTNQDLNTELILMAREYQVDPKELLAFMQKNNTLSEIQHHAINRKVMEFLNSNAQFKEAVPS